MFRLSVVMAKSLGDVKFMVSFVLKNMVNIIYNINKNQMLIKLFARHNNRYK
jgi:hypothetical protein